MPCSDSKVESSVHRESAEVVGASIYLKKVMLEQEMIIKQLNYAEYKGKQYKAEVRSDKYFSRVCKK